MHERVSALFAQVIQNGHNNTVSTDIELFKDTTNCVETGGKSGLLGQSTRIDTPTELLS
jgi:hypothetical protein